MIARFNHTLVQVDRILRGDNCLELMVYLTCETISSGSIHLPHGLGNLSAVFCSLGTVALTASLHSFLLTTM